MVMTYTCSVRYFLYRWHHTCSLLTSGILRFGLLKNGRIVSLVSWTKINATWTIILTKLIYIKLDTGY